MHTSFAEELVRQTDADLDVVLTVIGDERHVSEHWTAWLATIASVWWTLADLQAAIERRAAFPAARAFLAHWLHAALLRAEDPPDYREFHRFHAELADAGDPLGRLPLYRTAIERREYLRAYLCCGSTSPPKRPVLPGSAPPEELRIVPLDDTPELPRLRALLDWDWEPAGRVAVHALVPSPAALSQALLRRLGVRRAAQATSLTPEEAFAVLHLLGATNGLEGGRSIRPLASLGRLVAWRGLAAMTGLPAATSCADIELAVRACLWAGEWSPTLLVALRPNGTVAEFELDF